MKYKKYLLILLIAVFLGCNKTYAAEKICTYAGNNIQGYVTITKKDNGNIDIGTFNLAYFKGRVIYDNTKKVLNRNNGVNLGSDAGGTQGNDKIYGYDIPKIEVNLDSNGEIVCPSYVLGVEVKSLGQKYIEIALTNDTSLASAAINKWTSNGKTAHLGTYSEIFLQQHGVTCNGEDCVVCEAGVPEDECNVEITCGNIDTIFGDKNKEGTLAYLINLAMSYIRIIVPILIILLGSLDLAKAVIASKDDEIKKAQTTFIKRLIAGIGVFFVPVFVNIVIGLSNIVWQGEELETCNIEILE